MRILKMPPIDPADIFDMCVSSIDDPVLSSKFLAARAVLVKIFIDYKESADKNELYLLPSSARAKPEQIVVANIIKKEFISIYTNQLLQKGKPGRKYYDKLLNSAPLGKCPLCGFGQASTLDHFLSKSRYPAYSVLPCNLVPACTDCNKSKGCSVLTEDTQPPHLYFENSRFENEPWIYAEVIKTVPASIRYYTSMPNNWTDSLKARAANHFNELNLEKRFGVEAAAELSGMAAILEDLETIEERKKHLERFARVERRDRTNTWKAALYEALAESEWYQQQGFKNYIVPVYAF